MIIFLSGPIAGKPDYKQEFDAWKKHCEKLGIGVISPADMPEGLTRADYMRSALAQVEAADAILLLPGHEKSKGGEIEKLYAEYLGKDVYRAEYRRVYVYGKDGGTWKTRGGIEPFAKFAVAVAETAPRKWGETDFSAPLRMTGRADDGD